MHVVSTAGHVDHGKSTLIQRLTGIDPDRLAEEKARGLTIDLGFAWLTLPSGREIGIVDVPGHERFIHNMLAGVGSVDATIFVVAANEGWRPQSEEHLAILDLLGARGGVVALTKTDLVDTDTLEIARAEAVERLAGTTLAGSDVIPVSPVSGAGLDDLVAAIDRMLDRAGEPPDRRRPRVYVDRSFSIRGAGTVVTGTLTGGPLRVADEVEVLPDGHRARVRQIQTHKRQRDAAAPASRVALNLAGLERAEVRRGDAVVRPGEWRATQTLDVILRTPRGLAHALGNRGAFKVYAGSAEVDARLTLLERHELGPGDETFARLALASPVTAAPGDRFVLRDVGRSETVGGGVVLDPHPPQAHDGRTAALRARAAAAPDEIPTLAVAERGVVAREDLPWITGSGAEPKDAVLLGSYALSRARFEEQAAALERVLAAFHAREPLAQGMPREDARAAAGLDDARLFGELVEALAGRVAAEGPIVRLESHRVTLSPEQDAARAAIMQTLAGARFAPPARAELERAHGPSLVRALLDQGVLVKISDDIVFGARELDEAKVAIADAFRQEGPLTAARIRDALGTSRKYVIPLLEHLDRTGFTRRRGDLREITAR